MKRYIAVSTVFLALLLVPVGADAQEQFRQRIRHLSLQGEVWLRDDGSVVSAFTCTADSEQELRDGGSWPLKFRTVLVDGGAPNPVITSCARRIEAINALDGGVQ